MLELAMIEAGIYALTRDYHARDSPTPLLICGRLISIYKIQDLTSRPRVGVGVESQPRICKTGI